MSDSSNDCAPIVITGVGKRLGFSVAQAMLARGYPVIGTYRTEYEQLQALRGRGAHLYHVDLYDEASVDLFLDEVQRDWRRLRAIIHNASDWLADDCDLPPYRVMQKMMAVHVSQPFHITQTLLPLLTKPDTQAADIIHVTDYVAGKGSGKHAAYAASKAALANLTLSLAAKYAPSIKVNSIAPALILFNDDDGDDYRQRALAKAALPREGGVAEITAAVEYLLTSDYVTGCTLHIDGGRHLK